MQLSENVLEVLKYRFAIERLPSYNTPSGNYFWYRKRHEVRKLVERNLHLFKNEDRPRSAPPLWVDIGCGEGIDIFFIRDSFEKALSEFQFIGLEGNHSYLDMCHLKKQYYQTSNVDFLFCDVTHKLPFQDGEVDVVYCSEVIEHIVNPEPFLKEMKRIAKPNGYLILTTPNQPNVFQRSYWSRNRFKKMQEEIEFLKKHPEKVNVESQNVCVYGHVSIRTIREWDETLNQMGYKIVDYGRGAATYGGTAFFDNPWILGTRFLLEGFLDLLPRQWSRNLSDQLIALYQLEER